MKQKAMPLRIVHFLLSLIVASGLIYVIATGMGPLPPLGSMLNPSTGVWTDASNARPLQRETLHIAGLQKPVTVIFELNGTPHIQATTDDDLFLAIGYIQARFRLTQMDLTRRQAQGRLAEVIGPDALSSDQFQATLGVYRAAQFDWQTIPARSPVRQVLQDYAKGVNTFIDEAKQSHSLPFMFKLLNYSPQPWTPIDTLLVQGAMTQNLDFSTTPLDYALMVQALGYQRTMQWFPVLPTDVQHPYDKGSYSQPAALTPLSSQVSMSQNIVQQIADTNLLIRALPNALRGGSASNNWAVNGPKAPAGKALMAGDPHLDLTLPSTWYQMDARSPNYSFSGVIIPGVPMMIIGHNQHISWSLTDVQNASTLFYVEKTDKEHIHQYYWKSAWHDMKHIVYDIPVRGQATVHQDIYLTIHGPIFQTDKAIGGETLSIDWMGALPSTDSEALIDVLKASNFSQFRGALSKWNAPTLNFVYADDQGNIGMISPGYYPIVKSGAPWLPLPGTGESDIIGSIPYDDVPQAYNPPNHMIFTANQRPVSNSYPYYIGTTWNDFDNGYRANEISAELSSKQSLTMQDMEQMQNSTHDYLAGLIVPELLKVLQKSSLSGDQQQAEALLQSWNENMDANSPAASIWWTFWTRYLTDTFEPWWNTKNVPATLHHSLIVKPSQVSLDEDLETWTLHDPTNAAFTLPNGTVRDAKTVMLQAFQESIRELNTKLGANLSHWQWNKLHSRSISSLLGPQSLGYGPRASGGDEWTLNAVGGNMLSQNNPTLSPSSHGPSWRFIIDWSTNTSEGVYPGGQDENPASPWYDNEIAAWWNGQYYPIIDGSTALRQPGSVIWMMSN